MSGRILKTLLSVATNAPRLVLQNPVLTRHCPLIKTANSTSTSSTFSFGSLLTNKQFHTDSILLKKRRKAKKTWTGKHRPCVPDCPKQRKTKPPCKRKILCPPYKPRWDNCDPWEGTRRSKKWQYYNKINQAIRLKERGKKMRLTGPCKPDPCKNKK